MSPIWKVKKYLAILQIEVKFASWIRKRIPINTIVSILPTNVDAPPSSLIDSIVSPKVKTMEG